MGLWMGWEAPHARFYRRVCLCSNLRRVKSHIASCIELFRMTKCHSWRHHISWLNSKCIKSFLVTHSTDFHMWCSDRGIYRQPPYWVQSRWSSMSFSQEGVSSPVLGLYEQTEVYYAGSVLRLLIDWTEEIPTRLATVVDLLLARIVLQRDNTPSRCRVLSCFQSFRRVLQLMSAEQPSVFWVLGTLFDGLPNSRC